MSEDKGNRPVSVDPWGGINTQPLVNDLQNSTSQSNVQLNNLSQGLLHNQNIGGNYNPWGGVPSVQQAQPNYQNQLLPNLHGNPSQPVQNQQVQ